MILQHNDTKSGNLKKTPGRCEVNVSTVPTHNANQFCSDMHKTNEANIKALAGVFFHNDINLLMSPWVRKPRKKIHVFLKMLNSFLKLKVTSSLKIFPFTKKVSVFSLFSILLHTSSTASKADSVENRKGALNRIYLMTLSLYHFIPLSMSVYSWRSWGSNSASERHQIKETLLWVEHLALIE